MSKYSQKYLLLIIVRSGIIQFKPQTLLQLINITEN